MPLQEQLLLWNGFTAAVDNPFRSSVGVWVLNWNAVRNIMQTIRWEGLCIRTLNRDPRAMYKQLCSRIKPINLHTILLGRRPFCWCPVRLEERGEGGQKWKPLSSNNTFLTLLWQLIQCCTPTLRPLAGYKVASLLCHLLENRWIRASFPPPGELLRDHRPTEQRAHIAPGPLGQVTWWAFF